MWSQIWMQATESPVSRFTALRAQIWQRRSSLPLKRACRPKIPRHVASGPRAWTHMIRFFAFPPEVRRVIYTTNAIENVNARLPKASDAGRFPTDDADTKLLHRVFNLFTQVERPDSRVIDGMGIGLALVERLVHCIRGRLLPQVRGFCRVVRPSRFFSC